MRVTSKGQVTIPLAVRERLGISPYSEVEFVERDGRVYIQPKKREGKTDGAFSKFRGIATVRLSTDEIMALTRGKK